MTFSCTHSFGSCTRPNTNMGSLFSKNKRAPLDTCDKRRIGIELPFQWEVRQYHPRQGGFSALRSGWRNNCSSHSQGCLPPCYIHALPVELLEQIFEHCLTLGGLS